MGETERANVNSMPGGQSSRVIKQPSKAVLSDDVYVDDGLSPGNSNMAMMPPMIVQPKLVNPESLGYLNETFNNNNG